MATKTKTAKKSVTKAKPTATKKTKSKVTASKTTKKPAAKLDETGRRAAESERRENSAPVENENRKVQRRRQIDPTTCERDYTDREIEFMQALDDYKRKNGRMFPTCSEILEVLLALGYQKTDGIADLPSPATADCEDDSTLSEIED